MLVNKLKDNNILLISSAGNQSENVDDLLICPSCINSDNHISVGALNKKYKLANYSNYGKSVDVYVIGDDIKIKNSDNKYEYISGKCAMLWDKHPELTYKEIKQLIEEELKYEN